MPHAWLYLQSKNSDKHLPQSPFTCKFWHFALVSISLISLCMEAAQLERSWLFFSVNIRLALSPFFLNCWSAHWKNPPHCKEDLIYVFKKINRTASFLIPTFMYLWAIYIFPRSLCLFCRRQWGSAVSFLEIFVSNFQHSAWRWKTGIRTLDCLTESRSTITVTEFRRTLL